MFKKLLSKIARALDKAGLPYMVIGGQAVLHYGEPRLTRDIDITLGVNVDAVPKLLAAIVEIGLKPLVENPAEFASKTMALPAAEEKSGMRVDFMFSFTPYERQAIERAPSVATEGVGVKFASLEDVIIHKIFAGRPHDFQDVGILIIKNPKYDSTYIEKWLKGLTDPDGADLLARYEKLIKELP
jgi:predicted nucleotidyltransferase